LAEAAEVSVAMPAGTQLTLRIGAANREPAQFPDRERFDVGRAPNQHGSYWVPGW